MTIFACDFSLPPDYCRAPEARFEDSEMPSPKLTVPIAIQRDQRPTVIQCDRNQDHSQLVEMKEPSRTRAIPSLSFSLFPGKPKRLKIIDVAVVTPNQSSVSLSIIIYFGINLNFESVAPHVAIAGDLLNGFPA